MNQKGFSRRILFRLSIRVSAGNNNNKNRLTHTSSSDVHFNTSQANAFFKRKKKVLFCSPVEGASTGAHLHSFSFQYLCGIFVGPSTSE